MDYIFKTKPYDHQQTALDMGLNRRSFGYFMEMGTGKSKVLIDNMGTLYCAGEIDFALVLAPKGVYRNWVAKEIPEHLSEKIPHRVIRWVSGANKKQAEEMRSVQDKFEGLTIFVMNVESFSTVKGQKAGQWLARAFGSRGMIAIDESTTIKNHKAKRTKSLTKIAAAFQYKRLLTGSPITKSPMDIFSQADFLQPGMLGYDSFYAFQNRYAVLQKVSMGAAAVNKVLGYRNLDELTERIDYFSYRVLKKDCLDLPEKLYTSRYVSLTPEQAKMYNDIRTEAMTILGDFELVSAPAVITQLLRLQQVLCGHLKTDEGDVLTFPTKRTDALLEILEEHSGKAIIWSRFRHDIIMITETLNNIFGEGVAASYFGDTTDDARNDIVRNFQNPDHPLRFFIGNPATAGYGLTLTEANLVVYYANDFNLETRMQSEDRCHRIGQRNPVTYVDLMSEDTIDEKIVAALRSKIEIGAIVLGEEVKKWLTLTPKR